MSLAAYAWKGVLFAAGLAVGVWDAGTAGAAEPVDVELILAVDVSLSMSPDELEIQRHGYAAALTDPQVTQAIADGAYGKIGLTYFEWAGNATQHLIVPWTAIASPADAEAFAAKLTANPPNSARRTSISGAIEYGIDLFAESPFRSFKRVIDISGDGPNNQGTPVQIARELAVGQGIVINGLPLMTRGGYSSIDDVTELDRYYADCVIGGPGAFMIPVNDWPQFPEAVRRKLVLELAGGFEHLVDAGLPVVLAQQTDGYDCLVGEKMWRDRSLLWESR